VLAPINFILVPEGERFDGVSAPHLMNEQLEGMSTELRSEGFRSRAVSLTGSLEHEILSLAEREHIDLIVVGTHEKAGWERFISGSDAEDLYRDSSRPMLVIGPLANPVAIEYWRPRSIMCAITPQVPFIRLYRNVPQQELNLLQFTTSLVAQTGASPPEVVRGQGRNLTGLCFLLHHTPDDLGAEAGYQDPSSLCQPRTGTCCLIN
jgi:hypothetical protein